ncbi:tRNA (adenosine(37)-N6)-threonylcarbamoyltransferase complex ATPase subunit type 1 TsaE [Chlorobaculum sp. MV4-Y]|jgi:tRNA threonylcarbamoyladenosine biosynthesis protein TsaE|uniref:tRNA (adenosine(37)-N6)-threonylcarbamoyltransferase complex ATPase subunit type 1 TsaE n=1 Tax=Chlorobaculum sp. MV4-Y TaxID=2976335 RepID=UPI0021AEBC71|nr:tRNA (adenosine(37)-N6)-threonylcarbamoyltransferase complex ATPase subunit type 1 TsaE [Chlorobaculum sp. MV4-Y]UWX57777.1 tRNA (adenosine(37)-N6)-threonylcarbamoyltransferase complex ATPase subunit type 1 TsaE [Chlorobaculum sp. MV4-Y]
MRGEFLSKSAEETREYARRFASGLKPGDTVCLTGPLGAGKTEFIRGITEAFGCEEQLSSPTFSLMNIYEGALRGQPFELHHFDLYRLESEKELDSAGFDDYLSGPFLSVVEWGERFASLDRRYTKRVQLFIAGESQRKIVIT